MLAPISGIVSLLVFASILPNGIRFGEIPAHGDSVQIVAGYTGGGLKDFTKTEAAKDLLFKAYAAGAAVELVNELDRTAFRITLPKWAVPMLVEPVAALFKEVPQRAAEPANTSILDFREKVEAEIRSALLGPANDSEGAYATSEAFVLTSPPLPNSLRNALNAIAKRGSARQSPQQANRLAAERTLRFKSELPSGAVIFASPSPGVYYKEWYLLLLLDRLIHRIVPLSVKTELPLTVRPYYYRLEVPLAAGQFPEPAEESLLQELQRLQFSRAGSADFSAAQQEAVAYLNRDDTREWFASHDLEDRRAEGVQWVQSLISDDIRIAARDLLVMNRVIATWAPKSSQASVGVELLSSSPGPQASPSVRGVPAGGAQGEGTIVPLPAHQDPKLLPALPERLSSGVSIVSSTTEAVFVSGAALTSFSRELTAADLIAFQKYRADRILVLTPAASMDRARRLWSSFTGSTTTEVGVPKGSISSGDLGALFVLKTMLDLKLLESGWWSDVQLRIDAGTGSTLDIRADDEYRAQVLNWIKAIASAPVGDAYFAFVREVAIHHLPAGLPDLQSLTFERDPQATVQDLQTISAKHVQDVARIYF